MVGDNHVHLAFQNTTPEVLPHFVGTRRRIAFGYASLEKEIVLTETQILRAGFHCNIQALLLSCVYGTDAFGHAAVGDMTFSARRLTQEVDITQDSFGFAVGWMAVDKSLRSTLTIGVALIH